MDKASFIHLKMEKIQENYNRDIGYANERFSGRVRWLANQAERLMRFEEFIKQYDGKVRAEYTIEAHDFLHPTLNLYALEGTTWADMNTWVEEFFGEANEVEDHEGSSVSWRRFEYPGFRVDLNINELCFPVYEVSTEIKEIQTKKLIGVNCGGKVVSFGTAPAEDPAPAVQEDPDFSVLDDPPRDQDDFDLEAIERGMDEAERKEMEE